MGIKKTVGTITLATGILFSGVLDGLVNLNKDEKDNKVRQGVVSEWGIPKVRAEEVETLEEILESQIVGSEKEAVVEENVENERKVSKPVSERYPEVNFTGKTNKSFVDEWSEYFDSTPLYVYEKEVLNAEGNPITVRILDEWDDLVEFKGDEELTFLGEYIFNPDDLLFYRTDKNREKGYLFSFAELSHELDPKDTLFDDSTFALYLDRLIYGEGAFNQDEKYSIFSQIESGDIVLNFDYVREPILDQGPTK